MKHTLAEYEEGLLLFDLMKAKIWDKAEKDSLGLATYFNANRNKYQWGERAKAIVVTCDKKSHAIMAQAMLKADATVDMINKGIPSDGIFNVEEDLFEKEEAKKKGFSFDLGVSEVYTKDDQFVVVKVLDLLDPQPKELTEIKGKVISNYQDHLEKEWIKELKATYPVVINNEALKALKRKYN